MGHAGYKMLNSISRARLNFNSETAFSFDFFYEIFTEDASLLLLYHGAKKSKMTKNSNQGEGCGMRNWRDSFELD